MDDYIATTEAAEQLGITPAYLLRLIARGELAARRIGPDSRGGRWLVERASLEQLAAKRAEQPPRSGRPPVDDPSPATTAKRRSRERQRASDEGAT